MAETFTFQAEIQQLLDILVHSLYTEREIFLRELISNASDALNRIQFELLTNRDILDPDAELAVRITVDEKANTLTISDSGVGMTHEELVNNLGVIARSGARAFIQALKESKNGAPTDVIGQFGVGFYSVFMVADRVRVVTRSYHQDSATYAWEATGGSTFSIEPAERATRGTDIIVHLKEDAKEFASAWRLRDAIRRHSDYIAFPIYVGDDAEPTNKRTAIWRQDSKELTDQQYDDFYKMLTLDFEQPLHRIHMRADVPLQFYALLYIPGSTEPNMLSPRKEPGLKLYARKVLIQEYSRDLLPDYLQFVQGVVDSEDLPLNVSRESVQANKVMVNLKKTLTGKVLTELKRMAQKNRADYLEVFARFGRFLKQGLAIAPADRAELEPLLFFASTRSAGPDELFSLEDYVGRMVSGQQDIYTILGDDFHSAARSPHLDAFHQRGIEVLYLTDPVDPVMLMGLPNYKGHTLRNVDEADIDLSSIGEQQPDAMPVRESLPDDAFETLRQRAAETLGDRVREVRSSRTLTSSPARLVSDESGTNRHMYRISRMLDREYELPVKILELNPRHPLAHNLSRMIAADPADPLISVAVEQLFETALLQDGIHPDPASMAARLTLLLQAATGSSAAELDFGSLAQPPALEKTASEGE